MFFYTGLAVVVILVWVPPAYYILALYAVPIVIWIGIVCVLYIAKVRSNLYKLTPVYNVLLTFAMYTSLHVLLLTTVSFV